MAKARIVRGVALVGLGVLTAFAVGRAAGPYLTPPSMVYAADPDHGDGGGGSGPSADKIVPIVVVMSALRGRGLVPISTSVPGSSLKAIPGVGVSTDIKFPL